LGKLTTLADMASATRSLPVLGELPLERPGSAFISYSFSDGEAAAKQAANFLRKRGVTCFLASHENTTDVLTRVANAMEENEAVVFIISPASCESTWVGFELGNARALKKPVFGHSVGQVELPGYLDLEEIECVDSIQDLGRHFRCEEPRDKKPKIPSRVQKMLRQKAIARKRHRG